ncbi:hypothetical protein ANMWB30_42650 [Arthrobacter sp. MWB30]|nr:hypothetical protein ANMWB30_42650 [Arthrobacter sp. MWB30]
MVVSASVEPLYGGLFSIHEDYLPKACAGFQGNAPEQHDFLAGIEKLRHDHTMPRSQMRGRHIEGDGADQIPGGLKILLPAANEAPYLIDIQVQRSGMPVRKESGQSRLSDARRPVQQN